MMKRDTALGAPPCDEAPQAGKALTVGRDRRVSATSALGSEAIAADAIEARHGALPPWLVFGDGFDGEATFGGANTVTLDDGTTIVPTGNVYELDRDLLAHTVQVFAGVTVKPKGYRILCQRLVLRGSAIIQRDGTAGNDGDLFTGGEKVPGGQTAVIGGSNGASDNGGNGGTTGGQNGSAGAVGSAISHSLGGSGGAAGAGGNGDGAGPGTGGAGAAGGVATATDASTLTLENLTKLMRAETVIKGGAGGASGGGGGAAAVSSDGGGGGAGGSGGAVILIAADEIILESWTGRISCDGGAGGIGSDGVSGVGTDDGGGGAGGGGGGGGFIQVVYRTISGGALVPSPVTREGSTVSGANVYAHGGSGGAGGVGPGGATDGATGTAGNNGLVIVHQIGARRVPKSFPSAFTQAPPQFRAPSLHPGHYIAMNNSSRTF